MRCSKMLLAIGIILFWSAAAQALYIAKKAGKNRVATEALVNLDTNNTQ